MPGKNCSVFGCPVSRRAKYKGIGIFKVPFGEDEFEKSWREKLINIVTRDRTIDDVLKERIKNKNIFICEKHYHLNQISKHETRSSVIPGELPTLNLPLKSFNSPPTTPRQSSLNIITKRLSFQQDISSYSTSSSTVTAPTYRSFAEFKERSLAMKIPSGWAKNTISECFVVSFSDGIHMVPKFELFVSEDLSFILRVFLLKLPANHIIFKNNMQFL